jgi:hypothetical protein
LGTAAGCSHVWGRTVCVRRLSRDSLGNAELGKAVRPHQIYYTHNLLHKFTTHIYYTHLLHNCFTITRKPCSNFRWRKLILGFGNSGVRLLPTGTHSMSVETATLWGTPSWGRPSVRKKFTTHIIYYTNLLHKFTTHIYYTNALLLLLCVVIFVGGS